MAQPSSFSHILFDLDHTLTFYPLSTAQIITESLQRLRLPPRLFGSAEAAASRYDALWVALQRDAKTADELRRAIWRQLAVENGLADGGVGDRVAGEYAALRQVHGPRLIDGARALLSDLRGAGYGLGLLTNGEGYLQWETIHALDVEPLFDAVVVAGDIGHYKPSPLAFLALLGRLGATPQQGLFVGDSYEMDVVGARSAGLAAAWIRPDGTPRPGPVAPTYEFPTVLGIREVVL